MIRDCGSLLPGIGLGLAAPITDFRFSPDWRIIATSSADSTAKVWDAETGKELATLTGHTAGVSGVAFSPDGTRLATANRDGTMRVYTLRLEDLIEIARARVPPVSSFGGMPIAVNNEYKIRVVTSAGIGGSTAAFHFAKRGLHITVLEKNA